MPKRYYFWIVTEDEGTPYLVLGGDTEDEARRKGLELLSGIDFEIKRYPTRDLSAASAFYRGKRLENTHSVRESSKRIGHERSIDRLKKRKQRGFANR